MRRHRPRKARKTSKIQERTDFFGDEEVLESDGEAPDWDDQDEDEDESEEAFDAKYWAEELIARSTHRRMMRQRDLERGALRSQWDPMSRSGVDDALDDLD